MQPMTETMLRTWVDTTLKGLMLSARRIMPLDQFGSVLLGYGVSMLRGGGKTIEEIREAFETALECRRPE